jgi:hypothetical protein
MYVTLFHRISLFLIVRAIFYDFSKSDQWMNDVTDLQQNLGLDRWLFVVLIQVVM